MNMRLNILFYAFMSILCFASCKSETQNEVSNAESSPALNTPKGEKYEEMIKEGGVQVPEEVMVVKDNPSGDNNYNWAFLTKDILHYRNVVAGNNINANPKKDHWIDLRMMEHLQLAYLRKLPIQANGPMTIQKHN